MPTLDGRVLIFAGAGASKAVRNDMFPTTREFFDQLQPNITDQQLFQFAMEFLRVSHKEESIDIEHVLWALQTLLSYYDNIKNPKDIAGFALQNGLIERLFPGQHVGHLTQVAPQLCAKLEQLISDINQVVYDLYSYEPTPDELQENWIKIISEFEGFGTRLDIFTTDYDVAIEAALNYINGDVTARNWCGIKGTVRQTLDLTNWSASSSPKYGLLTKLHGSLDWKFQGEQIHVGDAVFTGDHSKQAIIYPGFKGASNAPFFEAFHEYLSQSISDSKLLIFIGFAFRDQYINQLIRENMQLGSKVFIINPDKRVKFPASRFRPKYIHLGFDPATVNDIAISLTI